MKSLTAVCQTGASMPAINPNGRIARHPPQRADGENAEMKMYLSKLKDLVPFMPKNRKLSKLEIIQHVIDYICDLQTELETHPEINNFDATAALNMNNNNNSNNNNSNTLDTTNRSRGLQQEDVDMSDDAPDRLQHAAIQYNRQHQLQQQPQSSHSIQQSSPIQRQPLADRQTPNTILPPATNTSISTIQHQRAQILVSASSTSSGHIPATYSTGSNNINSATTASHNSSAAIPTTTATVNNSSAVQLRMPEKNLDNSRQQSPTVLDENK